MCTRPVLFPGHSGMEKLKFGGTCPVSPRHTQSDSTSVRSKADALDPYAGHTGAPPAQRLPSTTFLLGLPGGHLFREMGREAGRLEEEAAWGSRLAGGRVVRLG